MPTRWLSIRKRNPLLQETDCQAITKPSEFDFAFGEQPSIVAVSPGEAGPRLVQLRPRTAGETTSKKKLRFDVSSPRPRTSESYHRPSPLEHVNAISKSQEASIGLALGSPSHPPMHFRTHVETGSPLDQMSQAYQAQTGGKATQMQSKRWKKLGTLFKNRHAVTRDDLPTGPTIGLPTGFTMLDKDPSTTLEKTAQEKSQVTQPDGPKRDPPLPPTKKQEQPPPISKVSSVDDDLISQPSMAGITDGSSADGTYTRPPLPKLELAIPRNVEAAKRSSSLLQRRSIKLESLKSLEDSRPTTKGTICVNNGGDSKPGSNPLTPLLAPRRLTTPTMSRSPAASKYSLFPTTSPAPVKIVGRVLDAEPEYLSTSQLKRSATSPARLSPMQDHFALIPKPWSIYPTRTDSFEQIQSPEDNTASTDREAPWSSDHSFQSSVSSATTVDEIFFDIKSFRDSKGVEDGQFVMTRPDSVQVVELARTRSKRTPPFSRLRQVEASTADDNLTPTPSIPPEPLGSTSFGFPSADTTKHSSVNTAYFDEAIAAVERLTTPTSSVPSTDRMLSIPAVIIGAQNNKPLTSNSTTKSNTLKPPNHHLRLMSKSHDEVSRLIPSPVVEMKEDDSPRPATTSSARNLTPEDLKPSHAAMLVSPRVAAVQFDRPFDDSPTLPQGTPQLHRVPKPPSPTEDKPPPVPKKDAKFIPMSKYAPKGTATAIEKRAGVIPKRPARSNTEDLPLRSSPIKVSKERSATLPSSLQPLTHPSPQKSSLQGLEKTIPPRPNPVALNPVNSAEVAIARTVSLARKQSARVHVPGPRLAARRAEALAQPQPSSQPQRKPSKHNRNTSAASQKSNRSFLGHRHKRSNSSKKATRASKDLTSPKPSKVTKTPADGTVGKLSWSKESEQQMIKEARKWEILEKKAYSPVVVQAERGHRPGLSVGLVVESA